MAITWEDIQKKWRQAKDSYDGLMEGTPPLESYQPFNQGIAIPEEGVVHSNNYDRDQISDSANAISNQAIYLISQPKKEEGNSRLNQGRDQSYGTGYNDKYTEATEDSAVMSGDAGKSSYGETPWYKQEHRHTSMYLPPDQYHIAKENIKREALDKRGEQWDDGYASRRLAKDYNIHLRFPTGVVADDDSNIDWNHLPEMPEGGLPQYNPDRPFQKEKMNMGNWEIFKGAWNTEEEMQDAIDERARNLNETPWDALKNRGMNTVGSMLQEVAKIHARRAHIDEQRDQLPGSTVGHLIKPDHLEGKPWISRDEMLGVSREEIDPRNLSLYQQGARIEKEYARNYQAIPGEYLNLAAYEYGPDVIEAILYNSGALLKAAQKMKSIKKYKKGVQLSPTISKAKKAQINERLDKETIGVQNTINGLIEGSLKKNPSFIDNAVGKMEKFYPPVRRVAKQGKRFFRSDSSEQEDEEDMNR